ncbi:hypothetical protein GMD78_02600 [Ornithinibacillus sp. L9]|uniref:Cell wall elongation regulator TseB-like domain-containing protein n=1 Tax=Ornithinibacillus caprae TaxID=2678566 RepID=A0A6N8FC99_9BACI|nr:DUF5590 domain-containing protein [Ornithinibacillus caprae]MUK87292.1 hypothetical protein [Ornithinibacillus caprae]
MIKYFKYERRITPSWVKWSFLVLILLLIIVIVYSVFFYQAILNNKTEGFDHTRNKVLQTTDIVEIEVINRFHGETSYHVVSGLTEENMEQIIFVPLSDEEEELIILDQDEIMSYQSIKTKWENDCKDCDLIKITPAVLEDSPLWELTYKDHSDRYVIDYVSMHDGSRYEQLRLRKTFK